jgi:hypothetical protein
VNSGGIRPISLVTTAVVVAIDYDVIQSGLLIVGVLSPEET